MVEAEAADAAASEESTTSSNSRMKNSSGKEGGSLRKMLAPTLLTDFKVSSALLVDQDVKNGIANCGFTSDSSISNGSTNDGIPFAVSVVGLPF